MSFWEDTSFFTAHLSRRTSIFGLRLWMVVGICFGASISLLLFLLSLCLTLRLRRRRRVPLPSPSPSSLSSHSSRKPLRLHLLDPTPPISKEIVAFVPQIQLSVAKTDSRGAAAEALHLGWGRRYALRELEDATGDFAGENVIGEGGYGIVYRGLLAGVTAVAVKQLLNNRGQAEKEFMAEVEAIGRVRHKNLVRLLGYCVEESHRILVYEYVDNGNLDQWLHGDVSPLSWDIRMSIILGTAKGLAYLHEGLEPKVIHRDVKSSNILVDKQWNSKISDFGLAKLLCSQRSYVTTRVMGTFGYVAPEYASTGMLNERSDVYSFGVLIMEIISGRTPVDYSRPSGEVNMVEWLKNMVGEGRCEEVVDPKILQKPSSRTLKTVLLVALRCVDPDALKRPKMGHVIHMLEMEGLLFHEGLKHERYAYAEALLHKQ